MCKESFFNINNSFVLTRLLFVCNVAHNDTANKKTVVANIENVMPLLIDLFEYKLQGQY